MKETKLNLSLDVTPEQLAAFEADPAGATQAVLRALQGWIESNSVAERLELVRTITRSKARVWNWEDLEREIFNGAI